MEKDFKYFDALINEIASTASLEELSKIKIEIQDLDDISDIEKHKLFSGRLVTNLKRLEENDKKRGIVESRIWISDFLSDAIIDQSLANLLEDYLLIEAPQERYASGQTYLRYVVPFIRRFIKFLYIRKGEITLTEDSLSVTNVDKTDITAFLSKMSPSPSTRGGYRKIIASFSRWLYDARPRLHSFHPPVQSKRERAVATSSTKRHGRLLTHEDIGKIFGAALGLRRPSNLYYSILYKLYLSCGLRPIHAHMISVEDIIGVGRVVRDWNDTEFVKIPFRCVVEEDKEAADEWIELKGPPPNLYISTPFMMQIEQYVIDQGLSGKDKLVPVGENTASRALTTLRTKIGIPYLTATCFRVTWTSVVYEASGHDDTMVKELGGWELSKTWKDHYKELMRPEDAVEIIEDYSIYMPAQCESTIKSIKAGMEPRTQIEIMKAQIESEDRLEEQEERYTSELAELRTHAEDDRAKIDHLTSLVEALLKKEK